MITHLLIKTFNGLTKIKINGNLNRNFNLKVKAEIINGSKDWVCQSALDGQNPHLVDSGTLESEIYACQENPGTLLRF